jgi:hypothetical protein
MSGTGAGSADPGDDLEQSREALREKDATNDAEFAANLKNYLKKLANWLKEKAYNYHKEPPEEAGILNHLRRELQRVYEDLRSADRGLLDVAPTVLKDRYDQQRLGIAKAELRSFLDDVYGETDLYLSAAIRTAAQHRGTEAPEAVQGDSALALARSSRAAANAYLRFAETFEEMVEVIGDMADRVNRARRTTDGGKSR